MSLVERALDSVPVMLDDTLLRGIGAQLEVAGVHNPAAFVLVELCDRGLMAAVVDASSGVRLAEHRDNDLSPRMLDLAVADHLVRTGRVGRPETSDWAAELLDVITELRGRLATADGAFAMGARHVGLLRVSRRDVDAALHPHLAAAQALWQSAALASEVPVGAIVFMSDHLQWPGLFATLAQRAPLPAIALPDATVDEPRSRSRHGVPGAEVPEPPVEPVPPVELEPPVEPEPTPVFASMLAPVREVAPTPEPVLQAPFPPTPPSPVPLDPPAQAPILPGPVDPVAPRGTRMRSTHEHDVYFEPLGEREPISVHDHRDVRDPGGPRHYSPPVLVAGSTSPEARRVHNRRLLIGAGAVASSAAVGVIVLTLPWIDPGNPGDSRQIIAAQTSQPPPSAVAPQSSEPSRPPIDTGAARAPATQYTAPPAPTAAAVPPRATTPRRVTPAPRPRPRPRSIPNPIPGLPPILLP